MKKPPDSSSRLLSQVAEEILSSFRQGLLLDLGTGLATSLLSGERSLMSESSGRSERVFIRTARANALRAGCATRVHFEVGNAANLRFEAETSMGRQYGMLHVLRNPVRTLRECWRVLKPDKEAWIYDPARVCSR